MNKEQTQSQEIMRLKAEIEAKETNREAFSKAYDKLRAENSRLKAENERLKEVIAGQNELCWNCKKSVKEFAEKLKEKYEELEQHYICMYDWQGHSAIYECEIKIDELLKEYIDEE